jgi:hypothetical protein
LNAPAEVNPAVAAEETLALRGVIGCSALALFFI